MKIDITVIEDSYYTREIDPDDGWDIGDQVLNVHGVRVRRLPDDNEWGDEIVGEPGDAAVVLVEHYSDGCTFGNSEYTDVKGVFPDRAGAIRHAETLNVDHGYFGSHIDFLYFDVVLPAF